MKICSFDIFDTCFVRACGNPENLFYLLSYNVLSLNSTEAERIDFVKIRIEGEKEARQYIKREEVSLQDIYSFCKFEAITQVSADEIMKQEILIEEQQLVPVVEMRNKIIEFRKSGYKIFFISDMYLAESIILDLLKKYGFWLEGDSLYVSSKYNATKRTGSLYKLIAKENHLSYREWKHFGDDLMRDFFVPLKLGICPVRVNHHYNFYESRLLNYSTFPNTLINKHLASISRSLRLMFPNDARYEFASDIIMPLYVSFVYNILLAAQNRGMNKVYFLSRDGYILYEIAKQFLSKFPNLEIKYLFVSRTSLYFPGLLDNITTESLIDFYQTIDGGKSDVISFFRKYFQGRISERLYEIINRIRDKSVESVMSDCNVISLLSQYYNEQNEFLLQYLMQEGLADNNAKSMIVDVQGTRLCQKAVNNVLIRNGFNKIEGYYLKVSRKRGTVKSCGAYDAIFVEENLNRDRNLLFINDLSDVLEQYFSISPQKRTIAYERKAGKVVPVFEENKVDSEAKEIALLHTEVAVSFCYYFLNNRLYNYIPLLLSLSIYLLMTFSKEPKYTYLRMLSKVNRTQNIDRLLVGQITFNRLKCRTISWWRGSVFYMLRVPFLYALVNNLYFLIRKYYWRFR